MHQAIGFLARRDHSVVELTTKLLAKGHLSEDVERVIQELQTLDYLDDGRYALMMVRHHYARGQGPQKIKHTLKQNGVSHEVISDAFFAFEGDWFQSALDVRQKRFGEGYLSTDQHEQFKEKSKQMRFLMTRGFEHEQVQYAVESLGRTGCIDS